MEQGTIVQWEKAEGDLLEEGDIIAQVETDKATMDMETPTTGYLAKILMPAGSKDLALGTVSDPSPSLLLVPLNIQWNLSIKDTLNEGHLTIKDACSHPTVILY